MSHAHILLGENTLLVGYSTLDKNGYLCFHLQTEDQKDLQVPVKPSIKEALPKG